MDPIPVIVKHGAKKYNLDLDPTSNGETFKYQVYSVTGVEPERQKIIVKGGQMKDDADLSKLAIKPGHQFMMMGTASGGNNPFQKPAEQPRFVEDMTEAEQAQSEGATPAGLQNMGNTCYLNSTLQTLRSIPELQDQLKDYSDSSSTGNNLGSLGDLSRFGLGGLGSSTDVTGSLRDLYKQMSETQEPIPPLMFLNAFRSAYPQFAERTREGHYAQQDAEEAWSQIISSLKGKLKTRAETTGSDASAASASQDSFIDRFMGGKLETYEECTDPEAISAGEKPTKKAEEAFHKLNCHVAAREILHLKDGVAAALVDTRTKNSPTLNRDAEYVGKSLLSRLPQYLPIHFVRFFWKRDVNKKAKILRKVTFPQELDIVEFCTEDLKSKLIPVRDKIRELRKEEVDVERAHKRQRRMAKVAAETAKAEASQTSETQSATVNSAPNGDSKSSTSTSAAATSSSKSKDGANNAEPETFKTDAEYNAEAAERVAVLKKAVLDALPEASSKDKTANYTGLYELRAVVTHKGPSADSGHYTAYVKKDASKKKDDGPSTGEKKGHDDDSASSGANKWWWFDDDRVTEVDEEKIETLSGGGETHSALILLYRAVELPVMKPGEDEMAAKGEAKAAAAKTSTEGDVKMADKS